MKHFAEKISTIITSPFKLFFEKIIGFCNLVVMTMGILIMVVSPIFAIGAPKFPIFNFFNVTISVIITALGCIIGTMLAVLGYAKNKSEEVKKAVEESIYKSPDYQKDKKLCDELRAQTDSLAKDYYSVAKERNELRAEKEQLKSEKEDLTEENNDLKDRVLALKRDLKAEKSKVIQIYEIKHARKLIPCEMSFCSFDFKENTISREEETRFHRGQRKVYIGLLRKQGTIYFGTDLSKLAVKIENNELVVCGNLHDFSAVSKDSTETETLFNRIEIKKYARGTNINAINLPAPEEISVVTTANTNQELEKWHSLHKQEFKDRFTNQSDGILQSKIDEFTKDYLKAILRPVCYKYGLIDIRFEPDIPVSGELKTLGLEEYINNFNEKLKLEKQEICLSEQV